MVRSASTTCTIHTTTPTRRPGSPKSGGRFFGRADSDCSEHRVLAPVVLEYLRRCPDPTASAAAHTSFTGGTRGASRCRPRRVRLPLASSPSTAACAEPTLRVATPTPRSAAAPRGRAAFPKGDARFPRGNETQKRRAFSRHCAAHIQQNDFVTRHLQNEIGHN
jgi:hypothetical protein